MRFKREWATGFTRPMWYIYRLPEGYLDKKEFIGAASTIEEENKLIENYNQYRSLPPINPLGFLKPNEN